MAIILAAAMTAGLLGGCGSSAKTSAVDNTAVQDKETAAAGGGKAEKSRRSGYVDGPVMSGRIRLMSLSR